MHHTLSPNKIHGTLIQKKTSPIMIPIRPKHILTFGLAFAACLFIAKPAIADEQPNIVIFYVDDLGWQDIEVNDLDDPCPYETPNIKKLASAGMNFTQAYSPAPTCSPSRAGIITGQHPAKIRLTHVDLGAAKPGRSTERLVAPYLQSHLDLDVLTLADAMKQNGYRTGHVGKWHVGLTSESYGFDFVNQTRGIHRGVDDRTKDFATAEDKKYPLSKEKYAPVSDKNPNGISYPYDELTESAIQFIGESKDKPFFLNMCHWMVHWPMLTRNGELLEHYCDKFGQPFPPKKGDMTLPGQQNPYFASMTTSVDWSLGRLVDYLEKTDDPRSPGKKLIETTYIFFTSDNGGAEIRGKEILSDNAPLKFGKKHPEEGGIRVPMIVSGPGIAMGTQFDGLVNQLDYFPTILKLTQSKISYEKMEALSGLDISPVLNGASQKVTDSKGVERTHLFWHFPHNGAIAMKSAIREGDFKLYKRYFTNDYELYRLYKDGKRLDLEEKNNLAKDDAYKTVVKSLAATLEADLKANNAEMPYLNPAYKDHEKDPATIAELNFEATDREAKVSVGSGGPGIKEAYVIYQNEPGKSKKKSKSKAKTKAKRVAERAAERRKQKGNAPVGSKKAEQPTETHGTKLTGMKQPVAIAGDGLSVSAKIPAEVAAYRFMLIDNNGFLQYSEVQTSK